MTRNPVAVTLSLLALSSTLFWGTLNAQDPPHSHYVKKGRPWQIDIHVVPVNFNGSTAHEAYNGTGDGHLRQSGGRRQGALHDSVRRVKELYPSSAADCMSSPAREGTCLIRTILLRFF